MPEKKIMPSDMLQSMFDGVISKMFPLAVQDQWKSLITQANTMEAQALLDRLGGIMSEPAAPAPQAPVTMSPEEQALQDATNIGSSRTVTGVAGKEKEFEIKKKKEKKKKRAGELISIFDEEE